MPSLFISTPGAQASLLSERLHVVVPPGQEAGDDLAGMTRDIPLFDIEQVVIVENANLSTPALAELLRREIPVIVTSHGDRLLGICQPPAPHSAARLAQYRCAGDPAFVLAMAANWVEAKVLNQRRVLQRLAANRDDADVSGALGVMDELSGRCQAAESLDTLRGYEGTAAGRYFEALAGFFPADCPFERRSRQPPLNAPNAILSYAYTIMTAEMECQIHSAGLDPAIGFLHDPADRRPSLALDLIEPFRAPLADAMALDLLNHGTLKAREHFERRDGGVYLNRDGRKRFFVAYERRMTRDFLSEQKDKRTSLRQEFREQVLAVKQAVLNSQPFEPFVMN